MARKKSKNLKDLKKVGQNIEKLLASKFETINPSGGSPFNIGPTQKVPQKRFNVILKDPKGPRTLKNVAPIKQQTSTGQLKTKNPGGKTIKNKAVGQSKKTGQLKTKTIPKRGMRIPKGIIGGALPVAIAAMLIEQDAENFKEIKELERGKMKGTIQTIGATGKPKKRTIAELRKRLAAEKAKGKEKHPKVLAIRKGKTPREVLANKTHKSKSVDKYGRSPATHKHPGMGLSGATIKKEVTTVAPIVSERAAKFKPVPQPKPLKRKPVPKTKPKRKTGGKVKYRSIGGKVGGNDIIKMIYD
jgi:hypothetical protein